MIHWIPLETLADLDGIVKSSLSRPQIIFKHSTRCSISTVAKLRLEDWADSDQFADFHYLDLISYRTISAEIAERFSVHHESPQVLIIHGGESVFDTSHFDITVAELMEAISDLDQK